VSQGLFLRPVSQRKETTLNHLALTSSAVLVVLLSLALAREVRLRRALQSLLKQLLSFWRNRDDEEPLALHGDADNDSAAGNRMR